jgi:hypothetical protein
MLMSAAFLTRKGQSRATQFGIVFGGFIPDLSLTMMVLVTRFPQWSSANLWRKPDGLYWQEPWQTFSAISNSIPLYIGLTLLFVLLARRWAIAGALALVAGACLIHVLGDLPVHADDAHVHFWPFTDFRFHSPISYWDRRYYGDVVGYVEIGIGLVLAVMLWRRFPSIWPRLGTVTLFAPLILSLGFSIFRFL